jgi:hypothetical protein
MRWTYHSTPNKAAISSSAGVTGRLPGSLDTGSNALPIVCRSSEIGEVTDSAVRARTGSYWARLFAVKVKTKPDDCDRSCYQSFSSTLPGTHRSSVPPPPRRFGDWARLPDSAMRRRRRGPNPLPSTARNTRRSTRAKATISRLRWRFDSDVTAKGRWQRSRSRVLIWRCSAAHSSAADRAGDRERKRSSLPVVRIGLVPALAIDLLAASISPDHSRRLLAAAECPHDRDDSGNFSVRV